MKNPFRNTSSLAIASALCVALAGCASGPGKESTGQLLDDSVITTKVKTALVAEKGINSTAVSVETNKGRVLLSGYVKSPDQRQRAEGLARQVGGVREVDNRIEVQ